MDPRDLVVPQDGQQSFKDLVTLSLNFEASHFHARPLDFVLLKNKCDNNKGLYMESMFYIQWCISSAYGPNFFGTKFSSSFAIMSNHVQTCPNMSKHIQTCHIQVSHTSFTYKFHIQVSHHCHILLSLSHLVGFPRSSRSQECFGISWELALETD